MAQLREAIARYHKLLETPRYRDVQWAEALRDQIRARCGGPESERPLAPVLRPHFISKRQFATLSRTTAQLAAILDQIEAVALRSPSLLNRIRLLPVEKMLAAMPSGYSRFGVSARLDAALENGSLRLQGMEACNPAGLAYSDLLSNLFLDLPIVREFKKGRFKLSKLGGAKHLARAVLEAWRDFGGRSKPKIAIVEFRQQFESCSAEGHLLSELFSAAGLAAQIVAPDELEYSRGRLHAGEFEIDVVFRRLLVRELLVHFDLSHPLLLAYREGAVCVVNNFRSELTQRRAFFELVTDEAITSKLPSADRKLIREFVPWTRVVAQTKTKRGDRVIDLPEFILHSRDRLALLPNEDCDEQRVFVGREMDDRAWDRALRVALRTPYVVQEHFPLAHEPFPVLEYGDMRMRDAEVNVRPFVVNGRLQGAAAALQSPPGGSTAIPLTAPILVLERK